MNSEIKEIRRRLLRLLFFRYIQLIMQISINGITDEKMRQSMATEPCSPVNKPGGPQGKGTPLPKPPKPESPGACSSPSLGGKK
jgi:hypothetical protein